VIISRNILDDMLHQIKQLTPQLSGPVALQKMLIGDGPGLNKV